MTGNMYLSNQNLEILISAMVERIIHRDHYVHDEDFKLYSRLCRIRDLRAKEAEEE